MLLPPQLSVHHCYNAAWNDHEADFEMLQLTVQACKSNRKWWWFSWKRFLMKRYGSEDASEETQMFAELG